MTSAISRNLHARRVLEGSLPTAVGPTAPVSAIKADKSLVPDAAHPPSHLRHYNAMGDATSKAEVIDVINTWAFARDQGRWDECAGTFTTDGRIELAWFQGPHTNFVAASRKGSGAGYAKHMMMGTSVRARGDRAFAETSVMLCMRSKVDGVDAIGTTQLRFLDKLRRVGPSWQIAHRVAVFDSDHWQAEHAGEAIPFNRDRLAELPRPYRYLAYGLRAAGMKVSLDLPTLGSTAEARVRADGLAWCHA